MCLQKSCLLLLSAPKIFNTKKSGINQKGVNMGVFSFMRRKKPQRELSISLPPIGDTMEGTISFEDTLPPPSGFDEDIPPPRSIDEIEIPEAKPESPQMLEFPRIPEEEPELLVVEEQEPKVEFFEDELEVPPPEPAPPVAEKKKQKRGTVLEEGMELEIPPLSGEQGVAAMMGGPAAEREEPGIVYQKGGPIFVNIKKYDTLLETIEGIKGRLRECATSLNNANVSKCLEDSKFTQWQGNVESIQRKLLYVDKVLFEK